jgi:hypothetical protein
MKMPYHHGQHNNNATPVAGDLLPRGRVSLRDVRPETLTTELTRVSRLLGGKPPFAPVGFDSANNTIWIIDRAGFLRVVPIRQLRRSMLISLCGAGWLCWLLSKYPERWEKTGKETGRFNPDKAADAIVSACQAMGHFDETRLRTPAAAPARGI